MNLPHSCEQMKHAVESDEVPVEYNPKFREYGVRVLDGGSSVVLVRFCPWCGQRLPDSLRAEWFAELEKRGIDPIENGVPAEFSDDRWYRQRY